MSGVFGIRKRVWFALLGIVLSGRCGLVPAEEAAPTVGNLEGLVSTWVDLRSQIAAEKREWEENSRQWREEIKLLETEKAELESEAREAETFESAVRKKRDAAIARKQSMEATLRDFEPLIDRAEARLRRWEPLVPVSLAAPLRKTFSELPSTAEEAGHVGITRRMQVVVALYTQIEALQHGIHSAKEVLSIEGWKRREFDVLYLGLARGFAVSPDGQWAAVGVPAAAGWRWTARTELGPNVRQAIATFGRHVPAALVPLPLQVTEQRSGPAEEAR